ncbi:hypothetical protein WJX79_000195 [Trebouxia sp. C0005]
MEWVEDVFYGAVTKGVNDTTVGVFKAACLACIASLAVLLYICWNNYPELITHCVFALTLSIFLYAIMYWFLNEIGTVSPAEQRAELFGDQKATIEGKSADTATVTTPKDSQAKKIE